MPVALPQLDPRAVADSGEKTTEDSEKPAKLAKLTSRGKSLLAACVPTDEEYKALSTKVRRRLAGEDEKWAVDAYEYCEAWGTKRIDKGFLLSFGTQPDSATVLLLMRVLHSTVPSPPSQVNLIPSLALKYVALATHSMVGMHTLHSVSLK